MGMEPNWRSVLVNNHLAEIFSTILNLDYGMKFSLLSL